MFIETIGWLHLSAVGWWQWHTCGIASRYDDERAVGTATSYNDTRRDDRNMRTDYVQTSVNEMRRDSSKEAEHRTGTGSAQCEIFVRNNTSYRLPSLSSNGSF